MWAWKITMCRLRPQMSRQSSLAVFLHWHWEAAYDLRMDRKMIFVLLLSGRWNFFFFKQDSVIWAEKAMAPHSSALAWKIPRTEGPGRLQSMESLRVRHDWATSLSLFTFMHWEKEMATHSSVLAWRIPGTGEPGGLPSMGSHRVRHDWRDLATAAEAVIWDIGL